MRTPFHDEPENDVSLRSLAAAAAMVIALAPGSGRAAAEDPALKQDAIDRLVESHDAALSVYIGRVYVKQAALLAARDLLAERGKAAGLAKEQWNATLPAWQAAEAELTADVDGLIERKITRGKWVQAAWSQLASETLNGEEADEIAVHFRSEGGQFQRRVIEWFVGELTLQTYTFTDRLKYGVPGSEREMRDLQVVTYERIFHGIQDFTGYPDAMRFASTDPGVKYFKMMVMQGVHAVHTHLEQVAEEARAMVRSRSALADRHIAEAAKASRS